MLGRGDPPTVAIRRQPEVNSSVLTGCKDNTSRLLLVVNAVSNIWCVIKYLVRHKESFRDDRPLTPEEFRSVL